MNKQLLLMGFLTLLQACKKNIEIESTNESNTYLEKTLISANCSTIRDYQTSFPQSEVEHLQGIAFDNDYMYLSYTYKIVKKDCNDNVVGELNGNYHFGDPTLHDGFLYVPQEKGSFNSKWNNDSYVYKIDPATMTVISTYNIEETVYGIGGIAYGDDKFIIIGGNDNTGSAFIINYFYEYDTDFNYLHTYAYYTGNTSLGLQVVEYNELNNSWITSGYTGLSPYFNFVIDNNDMLLKQNLEKVYSLNLSNTGFAHIKTNDKYFLTAETTSAGTVNTGIYKNQPFTNTSLLNSYFIYQLSELDQWMISLSTTEVANLNVNLLSEFVMSVDFKLPNGSVGGNRWSYFIAGGYDNTVATNNYNGALVFYPQSNNGNGAFKFFIKDTQNNQAIIETPANLIINEGVHYNLTATYDGTIASFYVDGELIGTSTAISGAIKDFTNFTVGATPTGTHQLGGDLWNLNLSKKILD